MTAKDLPSQSVLIFHGIGPPGRKLEHGEAQYWLDRDQFCAILDRISAMGADAPLITFDDGNASDCEIALPELQRRDLHAVFFLLTARLDQPGSLTSQQVRDLAQAGQIIGLHGHAHRDWRRLKAQDRLQEFYLARQQLSDLAGRDVDLAAAPFGFYDRQVVVELREQGFSALYTSDWGRAGAGFIRPRNCIDNRMSARAITDALTGHIPPTRRPRRLLGLARKRLLRMRGRT